MRINKYWKTYCVIMMKWGGLRIERKIFNFKKELGEKNNKLVNHMKKQKNERNNLKWTLLWIRSNKLLKIIKLQIHNGTREGTRTCQCGTKIYRYFVWFFVLIVFRWLVENIVGWLIWFKYKAITKQALDILRWSKSLIAWTFLNIIYLMEMTQWTQYWIWQKSFCLRLF